jgi:hypothetical protein
MSPLRRPRPGEAAFARRFIKGVYSLWLTFCIPSAILAGGFLLFLAGALLNDDWRGEHTEEEIWHAAAFTLFYLIVSIAFVYIGRYVLLERLLPRFAPHAQDDNAAFPSDESVQPEESPWQNP